MRGPPIPQRIPPLAWRQPAILWTPIALALGIGWPAALFYQNGGPQRMVLVAGAVVFAIALISLGVSWAIGRAPKARRVVVVHVVVAGAIASLAAPFVLTELLAIVANYENSSARESFTLAMSLAMAPLALVIGLPIALISGILFAWTALKRQRGLPGEVLNDDVFNRDVQPFR